MCDAMFEIVLDSLWQRAVVQGDRQAAEVLMVARR
jgi:hypothetical protein